MNLKRKLESSRTVAKKENGDENISRNESYRNRSKMVDRNGDIFGANLVLISNSWI